MHLIRYSHPWAEAVTALFHEAVHISCSSDYDPVQLAAWAPDDLDPQSWCEALLDTYTLLAVSDEGSLLGFGNIDVRHGYIDRLYTAPDLAGHGIGSLILSALEERGSLPFHVHASDTARGFFLHRGYEIIRENTAIRRGIALRNWLMVKEERS